MISVMILKSMEQMRQADRIGIVSIKESYKYLQHFIIIVAISFLIGCKSDDEPVISDISGVIDTWAGTGSAAFDGDGQPLLRSKFYWLVDVTVAPGGEVYILDWNNHRVRVTTPEMTLRTVIGTDFVGDGDFDMLDLVEPGVPRYYRKFEPPHTSASISRWHLYLDRLAQ